MTFSCCNRSRNRVATNLVELVLPAFIVTLEDNRYTYLVTRNNINFNNNTFLQITKNGKCYLIYSMTNNLVSLDGVTRTNLNWMVIFYKLFKHCYEGYRTMRNFLWPYSHRWGSVFSFFHLETEEDKITFRPYHYY